MTKDWEDFDNKSDPNNSRIISTDKIEEKTIYDEEVLKNAKVDSNTTVEEKNHYKIIKTFINNIEQTDKEQKKDIYIETITKKKNKYTTEKADFNHEFKYTDDIEELLIKKKYSNGKKDEEYKKPIGSPKRRYWKTEKYPGSPYTENIGNITYKKVDYFEREDEYDKNFKLANRGKERNITTKIIESRRIEYKETSETKLIDRNEYLRRKNAGIATEWVEAGAFTALTIGGVVSGGIIPLIGAGLLGVKKQIEHFKKYTLKITKRETWEVVENFETKEVKRYYQGSEIINEQLMD